MALWLVTVGMQGPPRSVQLDDRPAPCIQAGGIANVWLNQYYVTVSEADPLIGLSEADARRYANEARSTGEC